MQVEPKFKTWFLGLLKIGYLSFGGSGRLSLFLDFLVLKNKWVNEQDFFSNVTFSNFLPGPNIVNLTLLFGFQLFQNLGKSLLGVAALTLPGALLGVAMVSTLPKNSYVDLAFRGFSLASIALSFPFFQRMFRSTFPEIIFSLKQIFRGGILTLVLCSSLFGVPLKWTLLFSLLLTAIVEARPWKN